MSCSGTSDLYAACAEKKKDSSGGEKIREKSYSLKISESYYHLFLGEVDTFDGERIKGLETENENILVKSYKVEEVRSMLNDFFTFNQLIK